MNLDKYARKVYSQFDGDGVLLELVRRIETDPWFMEIGSGDGKENNTLVLAELEWTGLWVDEMPLASRQMHSKTVSIQNRVTATTTFAPRDSGVLSIDIDGNDYWIWKSMLEQGLRPAIVIIEAQLWNGDDYIMPYNAEYRWDHKTHECGAGKNALIELGAKYGYYYVGKLSNPHDPNLFFVREEYRELVEPD